MDRAFLSYYEEELAHIRTLATEFAALHPNVARNLSLDAVPCPDPYVERLLEGVAFLAARTRLKVDGEASRHVRNLLDMLYPDLAGPAPAMGLARLAPGPQVATMLNGHVVRRGTKLVSGLREGLSTRTTYTTAQDVHLWPVELSDVDYLQDRAALRTAGIRGADGEGAEAGLRLVLTRSDGGALGELSLDTLDLFLGGRNNGGALFDAIFGWSRRVIARPMGEAVYRGAAPPRMVGVSDAEGVLPRVRPSFEGYRLLREYFLMPERFHFVRLAGLGPTVRAAKEASAEIVLLLDEVRPELAEVRAEDLVLFATPLVNLFERECNIVEIDRRRTAHIVHADRTRPRDFEIYRLLRVADAEREGADARVVPVYSVEQRAASGYVYSTERRSRRPGEDEIRRGQTRTSYAGDDVFISLSRPQEAAGGRRIRRLDIRALCTNRDLPILDDAPALTLETGDPVRSVELLGAMRRPRASLAATLPAESRGETRLDDLSWRWIAQLGLDHISLAEEGADAEPLRAMLALYADRGDPAYARHARSITRVGSEAVIDRLGLGGPICFGQGTSITLDVDETLLSGGSHLLLSALLAQLFARNASLNSFARTHTRLVQQQTEVAWPMTTGIRALL